MPKNKPKIKPTTLIIIGIIYFVWPLDFPTFIDDIIVNILCDVGAFYLFIAGKKVEKQIDVTTNYLKNKTANENIHQVIDCVSDTAKTTAECATIIADQKLKHEVTKKSNTCKTTDAVEPVQAFKDEMKSRMKNKM